MDVSISKTKETIESWTERVMREFLDKENFYMFGDPRPHDLATVAASGTIPLVEKPIQITIDPSPENPTRFKRGSIIGYKDSPMRFMVVGENAIYLHTFVLGSGRYYGIFKARENLEHLIVYQEADQLAPLQF
jgi:hypothetical protein